MGFALSCIEMNHSVLRRNPDTTARQRMDTYLHIYRVTDKIDHLRYCTVLSRGSSRAQAEAIAINLVHQNGYHILGTDTATAAPWLSPERDGRLLEDVARFGVSLQVA